MHNNPVLSQREAPPEALEVAVHDSMRGIPEAVWDNLLGADGPPFLRWAFLDALERTGCVGDAAGWAPHHLSFRRGGQVVGVMPGYLKGNSEGEFVFDYAWAELAQRLGLEYYPKLLFAVPFTPATGPRLLCKSEHRSDLLRMAAEVLRRLVDHHGVSSAHLLFPPEADANELARGGLMHRYGLQYHFHNPGFSTFDDFLGTFNAKRRHAIRRERRELANLGVSLTTLSGKDLTPELMDTMFSFYLSTVRKFSWGRRYLNREFFEQIALSVPGVEVVLAERAGVAIGGALNYRGGGVLYGRYWGASEELPFLHFGVCYYHSIDACIRNRDHTFEPGAGGEHKRPRGFEPTVTHSLHHIQNPRFDRILRPHVQRERELIGAAVAGEKGGFDDEG